MSKVITAGLLFLSSVTAGILVAYLSVQGSYRMLDKETQFLREAMRADSEHRAQIYVSNLEKLLNGEVNPAIAFNCVFLKAELTQLGASQITESNHASAHELRVDKATGLVRQAERAGLCDVGL
jgi:putative exporter of polyketide antibiotics